LICRMRKLGITRERTVAVGHATSQWDPTGTHTRVTSTSVRNHTMVPAWLS
jgi:hypothetical protein